MAGQAIMRTSMDRMLELFQEVGDDDPWDDISSMSRSRLWLTHDEARQFGKELMDLVDRYKKGRSPASHPAGSRQISTLLAVVPTGKPPQ